MNLPAFASIVQSVINKGYVDKIVKKHKEAFRINMDQLLLISIPQGWIGIRIA